MLLDNRDFTLKQYDRLCQAIKASDYHNLTIREYFEKGATKQGVILLRHDIDENIRFALDMAKLEHERGVRATYYFRTRPKVFVPARIKEIAALGHEIGYHYETLDRCRGDIDQAIRQFGGDLSLFRRHFDVKTACMHGNPLSRHDNRQIWEKASLAQFGLVAEPYLSIDYRKFFYYSDSGRSWSLDRNKVKDTISTPPAGPEITCTEDLISLIGRSYPQDICILTHPERWSRNVPDYVVRAVIDGAYIAGKKVLAGVR